MGREVEEGTVKSHPIYLLRGKSPALVLRVVMVCSVRSYGEYLRDAEDVDETGGWDKARRYVLVHHRRPSSGPERG